MDLQTAINKVRDHNEEGKKCLGCQRRIPLVRKETLNKHKVQMLKAAAAHVMEQVEAGADDPNDFMVRDFAAPEDFKRFNFFSHLRLHGLVFKQRDAAGKEIRGRWGIARNGWSFLRGDKELHKYVKVKDNEIKERSAEMVKFMDVWRGEATIETSFEYFLDDGTPVGLRPNYSVSESKQERML